MKHLKDIDDFSGIIVMTLGLWGAILNFARRKKEAKTWLYRLSMFSMDIFTSGGVAIITYLTVFGYTNNDILSVGISGILAHQGTRAFYLLERMVTKGIEVKVKK